MIRPKVKFIYTVLGALSFALMLLLFLDSTSGVGQVILITVSILLAIFTAAILKFSLYLIKKIKEPDLHSVYRERQVAMNMHFRREDFYKAVAESSLPEVETLDATADQLFYRWDQQRSQIAAGFDERVFFICSPESQRLFRIREEVSSQGYDIDVCNDLDAVQSSLFEAPGKWKCIFVDIDYLESILSIKGAIDFLSDIRIDVPTLSVAIISDKFGGDDFGISRLQIADVSLRAPLSGESSKSIMDIMSANNEIWRSRLG